MRKLLLFLMILILPLTACSITLPSLDNDSTLNPGGGSSDTTTDSNLPDDKTQEVENDPNDEVINPENPDNNEDENQNNNDDNNQNNNSGEVTPTPEKEYVIKTPSFETRKINSIEEVTMDDFFNLGNRIDIKVTISNEELKKLQADYETGHKSEIYRLASLVKITLTNAGQTFTWEFENVGIRQKGNTSRQNIIIDGNILLNHYKLSFDETFDDPEMYDSDFIAKNANPLYKTREFLGMSGLDFKWDKNFDHTHIREIYSNYLYRACGIIVQHSGLSTLSLIESDNNNRETSMGLCTVYEPATKSLIKRSLKSGEEYINMTDWATEKLGTYGVAGAKYGDLYKCIWSADLTNVNGNVGIGNISGSYIPLYDRKTNKDVNYDDTLLKNASNAIRSGNYNQISKYVDLEYLAICEAAGYIIGNPDSMRYNTNNYMIYMRRTDGKMIFIPIDSDRSFGIIKDWDPTGSGMMYLGMLDRKNVNGNDTISLLLNTILANSDNEAKSLYIDYCNKIKASSWVTNETFNNYFNMAKSSYNEYYFSLEDESTNIKFSRYISNKLNQINSESNNNSGDTGNNDEVIYDNIYLAGDFNNWGGTQYKLNKIDDYTFTITITVDGNHIKNDGNGNYYKFKFSDGSFTNIDWTLTSDLSTLIKNANGISSARIYGVNSGDSVTITINTLTLEASVEIN